jgi:probable HAF family extracellular repeat protein
MQFLKNTTSGFLQFNVSGIHTGLKAFAVAALAGALMAAPGISRAADITELGTLGGNLTYATGISGDGATVVGESQRSDNYSEAYVWTAAEGMTALGTLGGKSSYASAASSDGTTLVGSSQTGVGIKYQAYVYTADSGMTGLGTLGGDESTAEDVSANGATVVGSSKNSSDNDEAFLWTAGGGMAGLGTLGGSTSNAYGISGDGLTVVGGSENSEGNTEAFAWTQNGMTGLGLLAENDRWNASSASDVSANGSVVVGSSTNAAGVYEAFIWTEEDGMTGLGLFDGVMSGANAVSADGSTVVGYAMTPTWSKDAWIWTEETGIISIMDLLIESGVDMSDWTELGMAMDISDDGSVVAGYGFKLVDDAKVRTAWAVDLNAVPVPGAVWLLGSGLLGMIGLRRRNR